MHWAGPCALRHYYWLSRHWRWLHLHLLLHLVLHHHLEGGHHFGQVLFRDGDVEGQLAVSDATGKNDIAFCRQIYLRR